MNATELISMCRLKVKPATEDRGITDANILSILNEGTKIFARTTKCLPTYATFDITTDTVEYDLSDEISDYLLPLPEGIWYYDGSEYDKLDAVTVEYLATNHSDWLTVSSSDPERAVILGDKLIVNPPCSSDITDGFLLYYCAKPPVMDESTNIYPFGGTSEIPHLSVYNMILVDYYQWQIYEILDINEPNSVRRSRAKQNFIDGLSLAQSQLKEYVNAILARSQKARLKLKGSYGETPFK